MVVASSAASIGLVFALFFSSVVMSVGPLLLQMKMGALLTIRAAGCHSRWPGCFTSADSPDSVSLAPWMRQRWDASFSNAHAIFSALNIGRRFGSPSKRCPKDALWWRANDQSNSVGNLLLHLNGNVRQWILGGVGRQSNDRNRAAEFAARTGPAAATLLADLDRTLDDVDRVLASLTDANLLESRAIQGRDITVLGAIYHVVEHFSQHLGQITLIAKLRAPGAINFYENARRPGDACVDAEDPRVKLRNFAGAIGTALLLALPLVVPTISRIDTWKIVLGIAGLIVFVAPGMTKADRWRAFTSSTTRRTRSSRSAWRAR